VQAGPLPSEEAFEPPERPAAAAARRPKPNTCDMSDCLQGTDSNEEIFERPQGEDVRLVPTDNVVIAPVSERTKGFVPRIEDGKLLA